MSSNETPQQKGAKFSLLWQFLKGAKRYFLVTILAASVTALADMLQPQIIRAAVDCALGGKEGDFPAFVMDAVNSIGGFAYLGQHLWIMALAILVVAIFRLAVSTCSGSIIPRPRKPWSSPCGISYFLISSICPSPGICKTAPATSSSAVPRTLKPPKTFCPSSSHRSSAF